MKLPNARANPSRAKLESATRELENCARAYCWEEPSVGPYMAGPNRIARANLRRAALRYAAAHLDYESRIR